MGGRYSDCFLVRCFYLRLASTNKLHVAELFAASCICYFSVAVVAMHFICVINDGRVWYDKLLWYVVLVVIPLMLGKLLGEILRKIIGIQ